jgi:CBS domain-containing protein
MRDPLLEMGRFNESGRGLPVNLSRPGAALPFSPLVSQAYAPTPRARIGWQAGLITVGELALDAPTGIAPGDGVAHAARRMRDEEAGWIAVLDGGRFRGVVWQESLLGCIADDRFPPNVSSLVSSQIPTCTPQSALVDAVREMLVSWVSRIPVVGEDGELVGILPLASAAQASNRDPAVRDLLDQLTPSIFARRWR